MWKNVRCCSRTLKTRVSKPRACGCQNIVSPDFVRLVWKSRKMISLYKVLTRRDLFFSSNFQMEKKNFARKHIGYTDVSYGYRIQSIWGTGRECRNSDGFVHHVAAVTFPVSDKFSETTPPTISYIIIWTLKSRRVTSFSFSTLMGHWGRWPQNELISISICPSGAISLTLSIPAVVLAFENDPERSSYI